MRDLSFGKGRPFRGQLRTRADACLVRRTAPRGTGFPPPDSSQTTWRRRSVRSSSP